MGLVERVKKVFGKGNDTHPEKKVKLESLVAVVVPRKVLTENDYKKRGVVDAGELGKYFHSCALAVGQSLIEVYGDFFNVEKREEDRKVDYAFQRGDMKVTYTIMGIPNYESTSGQRFSSDVTGLFIIQEPQLNLERAGGFINTTMDSHLLDYRPWTDAKFGVFYDRNGEKLEGIPLLKQMGINPKEAAEFVQVMCYGLYQHKVFEEGELVL